MSVAMSPGLWLVDLEPTTVCGKLLEKWGPIWPWHSFLAFPGSKLHPYPQCSAAFILPTFEGLPGQPHFS